MEFVCGDFPGRNEANEVSVVETLLLLGVAAAVLDVARRPRPRVVVVVVVSKEECRVCLCGPSPLGGPESQP